MSYNVFISVYDSVSGEHLNLILSEYKDLLKLPSNILLFLVQYCLGMVFSKKVRCTTRHIKENFLQVSAQSIQPIKMSCSHMIFLISVTY